MGGTGLPSGASRGAAVACVLLWALRRGHIATTNIAARDSGSMAATASVRGASVAKDRVDRDRTAARETHATPKLKGHSGDWARSRCRR